MWNVRDNSFVYIGCGRCSVFGRLLLDFSHKHSYHLILSKLVELSSHEKSRYIELISISSSISSLLNRSSYRSARKWCFTTEKPQISGGQLPSATCHSDTATLSCKPVNLDHSLSDNSNRTSSSTLSVTREFSGSPLRLSSESRPKASLKSQ